MQVSIIIVNYNTKELTLNCLKSIYEHTKDVAFEIILVDNASSDGSVEAIRREYPEVKVIPSDENLGFGRANNLGAKYAKGEFLFLLNSDTLLVENSIKKLYDFFLSNEKELKIGVLGGLMVNEEGGVNGFGSKIPTPTDFNRRNWRKLPLLKRIIKESPLEYRVAEQSFFQVGYVLGADMLLPKSLYDSVNGFDDHYFMYYEESDMQNAISQKGYRQYIYTGTKIVHFESKSFEGKVSNRKRMIVHSSEVYFMKKNYPKQYCGYKVLDKIVLFLSVLNLKYSHRENVEYIKSVMKKY